MDSDDPSGTKRETGKEEKRTRRNARRKGRSHTQTEEKGDSRQEAINVLISLGVWVLETAEGMGVCRYIVNKWRTYEEIREEWNPRAIPGVAEELLAGKRIVDTALEELRVDKLELEHRTRVLECEQEKQKQAKRISELEQELQMVTRTARDLQEEKRSFLRKKFRQIREIGRKNIRRVTKIRLITVKQIR
jgi:hypothetical protein